MPDQFSNPFKSRTSVPTFPQCIWDILRHHSGGLSIAAIVQQLQSQGLRDLSGLKKPSGQVANNLARHPEHFQQVGGNNRLWSLVALQKESAEAGTKAGTANTAIADNAAPGSSSSHVSDAPKAAEPPARQSSSITRRSTRSSSPAVRLNGSDLVGLSCTIWWDGEQEWFPGSIAGWDAANGTYTVQYADGDLEQGMSFVKYDVQTDSAGAQLLKVHDYKAGAYVAQAAEPSGGDAVPADAVTQPPGDEAVPTDASLPPVGDDVVPKTTVSLPTSQQHSRHPRSCPFTRAAAKIKASFRSSLLTTHQVQCQLLGCLRTI